MSLETAQPTILRGRLGPRSLADEVVVVTGAGGGIGLAAARSLLRLGARVIVAEIDPTKIAAAEATLAEDAGRERVAIMRTDVSDPASVAALRAEAERRFTKVDAVLNNATYAPVGTAVVETPTDVWDRSYAVNLRGPVLLVAQTFLPGMVSRGHGCFVCVSSTGGPYLAAYETLKAAQVALASSLDAELEGTGVIAFTIGPGLVPTETATAAIELLAPKLGMSVEAFWKMNEAAVLSVNAAGAGFAAAIALAGRYGGTEISSGQALADAGIASTETPAAPRSGAAVAAPMIDLARTVERTLREQAAGWQSRSFFERQWMLRDFKQRVGVPVEGCLDALARLTRALADGNLVPVRDALPLLARLGSFYEHLGDLARGYVKDPAVREEQVRVVGSWVAEVRQLERALSLD